VDKDLRASLYAACIAAALSALIGIFAGVGFLALFFRALVLGILVGAAAYGAVFLLRTKVPGVVAPAAESDFEAPGESETGANIDIVLPEEGPDLDTISVGSDLGLDSALSSVPGPFAVRRDQASSDYAPPHEEGMNGIAELEEASLLEPETPSAVTGPAIPSNAAMNLERRPSPGFEELDVLPDLEGFADSFTASEFASGASSAEGQEKTLSRAQGGGLASAKTGAEGLDPASLAQAVRTILKREQKG
jgi:hypothetical protein